MSGSQYNRQTALTNGPKSYDQLKYRVEPIHYDVYIQPFIESHFGSHRQFTFAGNVSIVLHAKEQLNYISIGAAQLQLQPTLYKLLSYNDKVSEVTLVNKYNIQLFTVIFTIFQD